MRPSPASHGHAPEGGREPRVDHKAPADHDPRVDPKTPADHDARTDHDPRGPVNLRRHPKAEPVTDPERDPRLDEGIHLYNEGHHWHAHEAWEPLWMGLAADEKVFVQGLIMSAAMLVQYGKKVPRGVANHWQNVRVRLTPSLPQRWGIDVEGLMRQLEPFALRARDGDFALQPATVRIQRTT